MASTNDELKNELEKAYPDYDVFVEGVGAELTPFDIVLRHKVDGHEHRVRTSLDMADVYAAFNEGMEGERDIEVADEGYPPVYIEDDEDEGFKDDDSLKFEFDFGGDDKSDGEAEDDADKGDSEDASK